MTGFTELVVIAFVAQLAVLPGEKVQFIIAGLSTRYHPLVVVSAAATAFAGWTALEILLGGALAAVLPETYLDVATGVLFLGFGAALLHSMPEDSTFGAATSEDGVETDGGVLSSIGSIGDTSTLFGRDVPTGVGAWVPIFGLMALGEVGDKTQTITIALALDHGTRPAIWVGEMLAIVPVSLLNAYFFDRFSHRLNARTAHLVSASLFGFFGADVFLKLLTGISIWEEVVATVTDVALGVL
ncbi:TMEM165/GDT1 family protein [Haloarchaeobius sp. HRN-SO-5]|uniref:TMEM165/GDT1 family protein n=1 Tax=Haloarchaeobius sp. HRN-SO-5 TaxID=3446118 RepID=UPI003EBB9583